jgi:hypothetical protein
VEEAQNWGDKVTGTYDELGRALVGTSEALLNHQFFALVLLDLNGMVLTLLFGLFGRGGRLDVLPLNLSLVFALQRALGGMSRLEGLLSLLQRSWLMRMLSAHPNRRQD